MRKNLRLVRILGAALLLVGATGFASGSYIEADYDCVSGTVLDIEAVDGNETADLEGNATSFGDLSAVEQRVFLEAYTDGTDSSGVSDRYANWSESWFAEMGEYDEDVSPLYVAYQGSYFRVMEGAVDCGLSIGPFVRIGGILGVLLGGGIFGVAGIWQLRETSTLLGT